MKRIHCHLCNVNFALGIYRTLDQAKALLTFIEAITEKSLRSTVALTAARGRGKSAALGLAVAAAIAHEYSNIFVTCPSPENLKSFFDFVLVGFDALQFKEHVDYEILQSTDASLQQQQQQHYYGGGIIVRIHVFRSHRQTIQYIDPRDASQALHQVFIGYCSLCAFKNCCCFV